jgi:hypothetical protein
MKKVYYWVFAAILICGTTAVSLSLTSCNEAQAEDNPIPAVKSKELIRTIHHGENRGTKPVILYMFYLSQEGMPLAV